MTKKLNPLEDPPTASSSDDEDIETSEGGDPSDEEESSEDDQPSSKAPIKTLSSSAATTTAAAAAASSKSTAVDSDSGSETETDSDSESTNPPNSGSGKTISVNLKKKEDPTSYAALALPAAKSGTKRPASEAATTAATASANKRVKKGGGEEESVKKPGFHRLWSEDDEIAVLQGMIDFKADTGKSPYEDSNVYYDYIKKSISFEVSKNQFMDKIRSLRKKFMSKEVKNGVEPSFAKAHDKKSYELAKFIWGPQGIATTESNVKSNGVSSKKSKPKKKLDSVKQELVYAGSEDGGGDDDNMDLVVHRKSDLFENSSLVRMIAGFGVDEYYVKQQWSLLPVENKKIVEGKLKMLQAKELEFALEKTDFLHEVASMIVDASKNKSH